MKILWYVLLVALLPGCAGILTQGESAPVAMPTDLAYDITLVVEQGGTVAVAADGARSSVDVGTNAKDLGFGLTAAISKLPLVGWMFAASKAGDIASRMGGGRAADDSAVTDDVLKALANGGKFTYMRRVAWRPKH